MPDYNLVGKRVFVAGHNGMVGSACVRRLQSESCEIVVRGRADLDLLSQADVDRFFAEQDIHVVIMAAAKVGGILANSSYPADFIYENLQVQNNVIMAAHRAGVQKLLFLGSSCIYPREAPQPIDEGQLLGGRLEPTNEWYAVAKIAGLKLCEAMHRQHGRCFISAMPTNLYGPGDNYHPTHSHVIPGLIRRFHDAKAANLNAVQCWGDGSPRREFLYVDDLADACIHLLRWYDEPGFVNVGTGRDITIRELTTIIAEMVGYDGEIRWDTDKPNGTMLKRLDVSRIEALGWTARTEFSVGLRRAYDGFLSGTERM